MLPAVCHPLLFSDWLEMSGYIMGSDARKAISVHDMGVPRHLQVPLSIDTSISYDFDTSKFPGLDDPRYKHEPVLLIAAKSNNSCSRSTMYKTVPGSSEYQQNLRTADSSNDYSKGYNSELIEDLLGIMDMNTSDLLSGLTNTEEYLSLVDDVIQGIPHSDELQYLHGPKHAKGEGAYNTSYNQQCFSDNIYMSRCASNGFTAPYSTLQRTNCSSNGEKRTLFYLNDNNYVNRTSFCDSYVSNGCALNSNHRNVSFGNNPMHRKRKRDDSSAEGDFQKKVCYRNDFSRYVSHYQTDLNNPGYGFTGTTYRNQIRVM